jgi:tetratricopeptide (TPR) repeat protein
MKRRGNISYIILTIIFILSPVGTFSQNQQPKATRQSALDQYSKGNFEAAYVQFSELSTIYPRDPLYKYYCGVSLVRLEKDPDKASILLKEAQQKNSGIRTIPNDVEFYRGRALQMSGNYIEAINSFESFTNLTGKKNAKDYQTSKYIRECTEKKGAILTAKKVSEKTDKPDSIPDSKKEKPIQSSGISNNITSDQVLKKEEPPSSEYVNLLDEALNYQFKSDSLTSLANFLRDQQGKVPVEEKAAIKTKIAEAEKSASALQKMADEMLLKAKGIYGQKPEREVLTGKTIIPDSVNASIPQAKPPVSQNTQKSVKDSLVTKNEGKFKDLINKGSIGQSLKDTIIQTDTNKKTLLPLSPQTIFSIFDINENISLKPDEKIGINADTDPGLIYRIQIAVFKNPVSPRYFRGINPVYGLRNAGSEMTIYYAGLFRKNSDASKALVRVKASGFKDAFVVALMDGKIVSPERAAALEKEWGARPFSLKVTGKTVDVLPDTIPKTLVYRVEVVRTKKPLTDEQVDNLKKLAGSRGFDIIKNLSGQTIYLIGKFLTFESAAEYTDLLTRNGYKEARVTAYLGTREIPVETARQLFEKF